MLSEAGEAYQALNWLDNYIQPREPIRQSCLNASKEHKIQQLIHKYPPPTLVSHHPTDILDRISRKSNRLRLKIVTKGNGKD